MARSVLLLPPLAVTRRAAAVLLALAMLAPAIVVAAQPGPSAGPVVTLSGDGKHPITPVMLFDEKAAFNMAKALFDKGIYVRGFTYPVVAKGKARIRVQISAAHTKEHMDAALKAFEEVRGV